MNPILLDQLDEEELSPIQKWLNPGPDELPDDMPMSIWDHLEELRSRVLVSVGFVGAAILLCFAFSKELVTFLEAPVYAQGVRFLQLSPGEYFFTTLKVRTPGADRGKVGSQGWLRRVLAVGGNRRW